MEVIINMNDMVTIYPNKNGWKKMIELTQENYNFSESQAIRYIDSKTITYNAYKDQLWCIIQDYHSMFFNDQTYFENSNIKI